jgi:hypothetical protein
MSLGNLAGFIFRAIVNNNNLELRNARMSERRRDLLDSNSYSLLLIECRNHY